MAYRVTPPDVDIPREKISYDISPRDTQDSGEIPSQAHSKFCGPSKPGLLMPCALSVRRRERHTSMDESLNEATNSGRVDVEGKSGKKGRLCETTCAELFGDSVDKADGLIETEDDVIEI